MLSCRKAPQVGEVLDAVMEVLELSLAHILEVHVVVQAMDRSLAAITRLLDAAERRRLGREREDAVLEGTPGA